MELDAAVVTTLWDPWIPWEETSIAPVTVTVTVTATVTEAMDMAVGVMLGAGGAREVACLGMTVTCMKSCKWFSRRK